MYEDNFDDFIPSTPSPVLNKRYKTFSSSSCFGQKGSQGTKDNHALKELNTDEEGTNSKSSLALPGQPGFVQEREKAIRNKKQKEHLSPFKKMNCGRFQNSAFNSTNGATSASPCLGGFVKSSSLLDKHMNTQSTVPSHKVKHKRKSPDLGEQGSNKTKLRRTSLSSRVRPSTSSTATSAYSWPSSSDSSSSDDEQLLSRFKTKPIISSRSTTRPSATITSNKSPIKHTSPTTLNNLQYVHKHKKHSAIMKDKFKSKTCNATHKETSAVSTSPPTASNESGALLTAPWYNYMSEERRPGSVEQSPLQPSDLQTNIHTPPRPHTTSVLNNARPTTPTLPSWSGSPFSAEWKTPDKKANVTPKMSHKQHSSSDSCRIDVLHPEGGEDNPIDVDMDNAIDVDLLTPDTLQAITNVQQMQSDEDIARKLQEELDREFAMSIQEQAEQAEDTPVEDGARFFTPPLCSPVRTRPRRAPRGAARGGRSNSMRNELRDLLQDTENSMIGPDLDFILALSSARRERRGAFSIAGFPGMMTSPSATGNDYEFLMNLSEQIGDAKPKGLSKSASNQLPVVTYKKQEDKCEECHICMTEYEEGDSQKILPCFHNYHAKCIDKWIAKNATCPVCRVEVKLD